MAENGGGRGMAENGGGAAEDGGTTEDGGVRRGRHNVVRLRLLR